MRGTTVRARQAGSTATTGAQPRACANKIDCAAAGPRPPGRTRGKGKGASGKPPPAGKGPNSCWAEASDVRSQNSLVGERVGRRAGRRVGRMRRGGLWRAGGLSDCRPKASSFPPMSLRRTRSPCFDVPVLNIHNNFPWPLFSLASASAVLGDNHSDSIFELPLLVRAGRSRRIHPWESYRL